MQNSPEIGYSFYKFVLENPAKYDFFSLTYMYQKPVSAESLNFNRPNTISARAFSDCLKQHSKTVQYM